MSIKHFFPRVCSVFFAVDTATTTRKCRERFHVSAPSCSIQPAISSFSCCNLYSIIFLHIFSISYTLLRSLATRARACMNWKLTFYDILCRRGLYVFDGKRFWFLFFFFSPWLCSFSLSTRMLSQFRGVVSFWAFLRDLHRLRELIVPAEREASLVVSQKNNGYREEKSKSMKRHIFKFEQLRSRNERRDSIKSHNELHKKTINAMPSNHSRYGHKIEHRETSKSSGTWAQISGQRCRRSLHFSLMIFTAASMFMLKQ